MLGVTGAGAVPAPVFRFLFSLFPLEVSMFKTVTEYRREFEYADGDGGFGFECDADGVPVLRYAAAAANWRACLSGAVNGLPVVDRGLVKRTYEIRVCHCGSGERPWLLSDARGIPVAKVCGECVDSVKSKYRPEIFEDGAYECDERIEPLD